MSKPPTQVVRINSQGDLVFALSQMLGFRPEESIVIACMNGPRQRLGLTLRYDLAWLAVADLVTADIEPRVRAARPDDIFIAVFSDALVTPGEELPHTDLVDSLGCALGDLILDIALVGRDRWWSYGCDNPRCCPPEGSPLDPASPGATELSAAYAIHGKAPLPTRDAVVQSIGFDGDEATADRIGDLIEERLCDLQVVRQDRRREDLRTLLSRLAVDSRDPRHMIREEDVVEFVSLIEDVIVRDEILARAAKSRRREVILRVLMALARRTPFPYDAALCATLAYVAYADGNGIIANIALDRAFAADPDYSLAQLTADAVARQIPPTLLCDAMREAGRDLKGPEPIF